MTAESDFFQAWTVFFLFFFNNVSSRKTDKGGAVKSGIDVEEAARFPNTWQQLKDHKFKLNQGKSDGSRAARAKNTAR